MSSVTDATRWYAWRFEPAWYAWRFEPCGNEEWHTEKWETESDTYYCPNVKLNHAFLYMDPENKNYRTCEDNRQRCLNAGCHEIYVDGNSGAWDDHETYGAATLVTPPPPPTHYPNTQKKCYLQTHGGSCTDDTETQGPTSLSFEDEEGAAGNCCLSECEQLYLSGYCHPCHSPNSEYPCFSVENYEFGYGPLTISNLYCPNVPVVWTNAMLQSYLHFRAVCEVNRQRCLNAGCPSVYVDTFFETGSPIEYDNENAYGCHPASMEILSPLTL